MERTLADHAALTDTIPPASHPYFGAQGCFLKYCDEVRGLTDPDFVEAQLKIGRIDCAAMSRALIADPDWPKKAAQGRAGEIRRCVRCNKECLGGMMAHRGVHCIYERKV